MVYVLNAPVLTNYGTYSFREVNASEARQALSNGFVSAVGHESTAAVMSSLIGLPVPYNRIAVHMEPGDRAVILWLRERPEEGTVYSEEELSRLPKTLGLLERIA